MNESPRGSVWEVGEGLRPWELVVFVLSCAVTTTWLFCSHPPQSFVDFIWTCLGGLMMGALLGGVIVLFVRLLPLLLLIAVIYLVCVYFSYVAAVVLALGAASIVLALGWLLGRRQWHGKSPAGPASSQSENPNRVLTV